jgi:hypothetical protein
LKEVSAVVWRIKVSRKLSAPIHFNIVRKAELRQSFSTCVKRMRRKLVATQLKVFKNPINKRNKIKKRSKRSVHNFFWSCSLSTMTTIKFLGSLSNLTSEQEHYFVSLFRSLFTFSILLIFHSNYAVISVLCYLHLSVFLFVK